MQNLHMVYIGNDRDRYIGSYADEISTFNADEYRLLIWSEDSIRGLIRKRYGAELLSAYDSYIPYAYRADIARLAILDSYGGWYSDFGIKKIGKFPDTDSIDFFICKDIHTMNKWGVDLAFQNSLIYATKDNSFIKKCLQQIVVDAKNMEYGENYHDVTGPIFLARMYRSYAGSEIFLIGQAGPQEIDGRIAYHLDEKTIALFKNQNINNKLKAIDAYKTDYSIAWKDRMVFRQ